MTNPLTHNDISAQYKDKIITQNYSKKNLIEGVKIIDIINNIGDDSDFSEIIRLDDTGATEIFPEFKLKQVNRTKLHPKSIKAWHLHFRQDEFWYVLPESQILVGLWDLREISPTKDQKMRFSLGGGKSQLLYIPKGVAHGLTNLTSTTANMFYFVDQVFDKNNPDEQRINWDMIGREFWSPEKN